MANDLAKRITGNFVTRYFFRLLTDILSIPSRRLVYVSTVLGALSHGNYPDKDVVCEINRTLRLSQRFSTIMLSVPFGGWVWKNAAGSAMSLSIGEVTVRDIDLARLSDTDLWRLGVHLTKFAPSWLRYGSDALMSADVHDALGVVITSSEPR